MAGAITLPPEIVTRILEHVDAADNREIHSSYALISSSWNQAASSLARAVCRHASWHAAGAASFQAWLHKHGQHISQLQVHHVLVTNQDLHLISSIPCPQLQQLDLANFKVMLAPPAAPAAAQAPAADAGAGFLAEAPAEVPAAVPAAAPAADIGAGSSNANALTGCPGLLRLSLHNCNKSEGPDALLGLAACPGITQLTLNGVKCSSNPAEPVSLQPLSHLSSLQDLTLRARQGSLGSLRGLTALSRLHISCAAAGQKLMLSEAATPGIAEDMTQLRHLEMDSIGANHLLIPLLRKLSSLQHLALARVALRTGPGGGPHAGSAGGQQILEVLAELPGLTYLDLQWSLMARLAPVEAFTALTACSNLRHINLTGCQLPRGFGQHMFRAQQQQAPAFPQLRQLKLPDSDLYVEDVGMGGADLSLLAKACPGLQELDVAYSLQYDVSLVPLQSLSALTTLSVSRLVEESSAAELAALTGLLKLNILDSDFDDVQLM